MRYGWRTKAVPLALVSLHLSAGVYTSRLLVNQSGLQIKKAGAWGVRGSPAGLVMLLLVCGL